VIVAFGSGRGRVVVQVEEGLAEHVAALFPEDLSLDAGGLPSIEVRARDMGFELVRSGPPRRVELSRSLPDLLVSLEHTLCRTLLAAEAESAHLHASGAVVDGRAILALGPSGAGKSSLALAWSEAGLPLLGDDVVLVDSAGWLRPFRRLLKVDGELFASRGGRPEETLAFDPDAEEVWYDPRGAGGWADAPAPPGLVAWVTFDGSDAVRAEVLGEADALRHLLDAVMGSGVPPALAMDRMIPWLPECRAVRVGFGSAVDAATLLVDWLRAAPLPDDAAPGSGA